MEYKQKRFATFAEFTFEDDDLTYRIKDNSGDVEFSIPYANIPWSNRKVFDRNNWLRNIGLIWCVIGLIQIGLAISGSRPLSGSGFWLLIGLGCLGFYRFTWSQYTVLDTEEGSIWIIDNDQHDEILNAIETRRKEKLLAWYQGIEFNDDVENEIQTLEWLVKNKVLTRDEGSERINKLKSSETKLITDDNSQPATRLH